MLSRPIGNNVGLSGICPMFLIVQPYLMISVALLSWLGVKVTQTRLS